MQTDPQSVSQPASHLVKQSVSQSAALARVEARRRALCLSREAPDTTVASPGPSQWLFAQKPTQWDNGPGSEWGWTAELRLPTCTLQDPAPPPPYTRPHPSSLKEPFAGVFLQTVAQGKRSFGFRAADDAPWHSVGTRVSQSHHRSKSIGPRIRPDHTSLTTRRRV